MTHVQLWAIWAITTVIIVACAMLLDGCAASQGRVMGPHMVAQDGPEARYSEVQTACTQPPHLIMRRNHPIITPSGMAVWCY